MINKKKVWLLIASGIFLSLAIFFFFYDLEISKLVVQENPNGLFVLLAAIGEFPIYIGPLLFGLVYGFTSENKYAKLGFHLVGLITVYVASIRLVSGIFEEFFSSNLGAVQEVLLAVVSLLVYILLFIWMSKKEISKLEKIKDVVLLSCLVSLSSFLMVSGIKILWGRPRFYSLSGDYSGYTNYLTINGPSNSIFSNDYRSFPSGHTNSAACILVVPFIVSRICSNKYVKIIITIFCCTYALLVGISRIVVGAHYASDVLFAFLINIGCFILVGIFLKKKGWLHVRSNKC